MWGVYVLQAGWALQRTQHGKGMKTIPNYSKLLSFKDYS